MAKYAAWCTVPRGTPPGAIVGRALNWLQERAKSEDVTLVGKPRVYIRDPRDTRQWIQRGDFLFVVDELVVMAEAPVA